MEVKLEHIASVLDCDPILERCCKSNNINEWSFRKPINNDGVTAVTDDTLYSINDGFNIPLFENPQAMLHGLQHNNNVWKYQSRFAPYRLTDFDGYEHFAGPMCNLIWESDNFGRAGDTLQLSCSDFYNIITHWDYFNGYWGVDLVFLMYEQNTQYYGDQSQGIYVVKFKSFSDYIQGQYLDFKIPSLTPRKHYDIVFCATDTTDHFNDGECRYCQNTLEGNWWCFPPHCKATVIINP